MVKYLTFIFRVIIFGNDRGTLAKFIHWDVIVLIIMSRWAVFRMIIAEGPRSLIIDYLIMQKMRVLKYALVGSAIL